VLGIGPEIAGQARRQVGRRAQHVHHGAAGQGVEQDGDRRGRGQLAAADAAPDDGPRGQHLRTAHGRVVLGYPGNGGRLHVQAQHGPAVAPGVQLEHLGRQFGQVAPQGPGVRVRHPGQPPGHRVGEQRLLGAPAQVHRGLADPGPPGDRLHREPGPARLTEQVERRLGDPAVHLRVAGAPGAHVRGSHHGGHRVVLHGQDPPGAALCGWSPARYCWTVPVRIRC
jgi:hypothetical protein